MDDIIRQGYCVCGSDDLDYDRLELIDGFVMYPFTCNACYKKGKEWYALTFEETVMIEKE